MTSPTNQSHGQGAPSSPMTQQQLTPYQNPNENDDGSSFEAVLREKSRQRREREDAAVASLRVQVQHLEAALQAETKRRISSTLELQERATVEITQLEQRLKASLQEQQNTTNQRFENMEARLSDLEERWRKDHVALEKGIQKESRDIRDRLNKVQHQTDVEERARKERENGLGQQLEELSQTYQEKWNTERQERTVALHSLQERLDNQNAERTQQFSSYTDELQSELDALRIDLQEEGGERKDKDDEIVAALNRYIEQFQKSLAVL